MADTAKLRPMKEAFYAPVGMLRVEKGFNIRKNPEPSDELLASVAANGVRVPLQVRSKGGKTTLWLIDGERRLKAAKKAKLGEVPVIHNQDMEDVESLILSVTSKDQEPFKEDELADAIIRLHKADVSPEDIAKHTGFSLRKVTEVIKIEENASDALKKKKLDSRVAARAAGLPKGVQNQLAPKLAAQNRNEALDTIRQAEKASGKTKNRGRKPNTFPVARDVKARIEALDKHINNELRYDAKNAVRRGQRDVIDVMKGIMSVSDFTKK